MRTTLDLPHLKPATPTSNAKYRRRIPDDLRGVFDKSAIDGLWGTKGPAKIYEAWKIAHEKYEAMSRRRTSVSTEHIKWEIAQKAAIEHGLATRSDTQIGPVDFESEQWRF